MCIKSRIEKIKPVKLAEDRCLQYMNYCKRILRMCLLNALKLGNRFLVFQVVEIV